MTFFESIARYVVHKNQSGVMFDSGKRYLVSLSRRIGDKDLSMVRVDDVMTFLGEISRHKRIPDRDSNHTEDSLIRPFKVPVPDRARSVRYG
jgi:hypothetical protein